jgi:hypothetical protein
VGSKCHIVETVREREDQLHHQHDLPAGQRG